MTLIAIDAGGTRFGIGAFTPHLDRLRVVEVPTRGPEETLVRLADRVLDLARGSDVASIGAALFGPLCLDRADEGFGAMRRTPKAGWEGVNVPRLLRERTGLPVHFDLDVRAAVYAERGAGAARDCDRFAFVSIGTGICGFLASAGGGEAVRHPELGHMSVPRERGDDFEGSCPFHGDCLEGLASGSAMEQRWRRRPEELPVDHAAWELEARYLARAIADLTFIAPPDRVVLGGGIGCRAHLIQRVAAALPGPLGGYLGSAPDHGLPRDYLVPSAFGRETALVGAAMLARDARGHCL